MHLGTSVMFIILSKCLKASLCHSAHGSGGQIDAFAASAALQPNADYTKERLERLPWARYGSCSAVGIVRTMTWYLERSSSGGPSQFALFAEESSEGREGAYTIISGWQEPHR